MINEFVIEGIDEANACFDNLKRELLNPKEPLKESAFFMREEALRNFDEDGGAFGEPWAPLKDKTLEIKEREGYGGQPMMVRTEKLRSSFFVENPIITGDGGSSEVFNPTLYAINHQLGIGRNLPIRVLLKFAQVQRDNITNIFFDWVVKKVRESFSNG